MCLSSPTSTQSRHISSSCKGLSFALFNSKFGQADHSKFVF
jgi:hypothetical protein